MTQIEKGRSNSAERGLLARRSFMEIITDPNTDRVVGIVAVLPFIYPLYTRLQGDLLNFPNLAAISAGLILIGTMFTRRAPVRVTPNPFYWLLAFVATYGTLVPFAFAEPGRQLLPPIATNAIAATGLIVTIYARLSLGRNIGFVPAQRRLVTTGAYRFVRHPIYAGLILAFLGNALRNFTPLFAGMGITLVALVIIKCLVEENFLRKDPVYEQYLQEVRYRWIPGIL